MISLKNVFIGVVSLVVVTLSAAFGAMLLMKLPSREGDLTFRPAGEAELKLRSELERHVVKLAGDIGPRGLAHAPGGLDRARTYLKQEFEEMGYAVKTQHVRVDDLGGDNLFVEIPGTDKAKGIIVLAAHYDSWMAAPGANDNASGVASLLALARRLRGRSEPRSLIFAALVNEEPPFFKTEHMGSEHFAAMLKEENRAVELMLSLETMGYYTAKPKTQQYPFPFELLFTDRGVFLGLVSNIASRAKFERLGAVLQSDDRIITNGMALPTFIPGVDWSDHWSFWQRGYDAVMVTDTALFRYPYYHTTEDTPDKIDYDTLTGVVLAVEKGVLALAR